MDEHDVEAQGLSARDRFKARDPRVEMWTSRPKGIKTDSFDDERAVKGLSIGGESRFEPSGGMRLGAVVQIFGPRGFEGLYEGSRWFLLRESAGDLSRRYEEERFEFVERKIGEKAAIVESRLQCVLPVARFLLR